MANVTPSRGQSGFTLVEILIVVVIVAALAALVGPQVFGRLGGAKQKMARTQIEVLGTALDTFRLDVGRYPDTDEGLSALREAPADLNNWDGPYLKKDVPNDPWDRPYQYQSPGDNGEYDLYTLGKDGQEGGEGEDADVQSWTN